MEDYLHNPCTLYRLAALLTFLYFFQLPMPYPFVGLALPLEGGGEEFETTPLLFQLALVFPYPFFTVLASVTLDRVESSISAATVSADADSAPLDVLVFQLAFDLENPFLTTGEEDFVVEVLDWAASVALSLVESNISEAALSTLATSVGLISLPLGALVFQDAFDLPYPFFAGDFVAAAVALCLVASSISLAIALTFQDADDFA